MEEKLSNEHRLTAVENRAKSNTIRIDALEKRVDDTEKLATSIAVIAEKQNQMGSDISNIKTNLQKLAEVPGKRWEGVVEKVIALVIAGVVAYMLTKLGF